MKLPTTALQTAVRRFDYKLVSTRAFSRKWQLRNVSQKGCHFSELPAWCSELRPTDCWPVKISRVMHSLLVGGMLGLPGSCCKNARWIDLEAPALPADLDMDSEGLNSPPKPSALPVFLPWQLLTWQFLIPSSEAHYSVAALILLSMSGNSNRKTGVKKQGRLEIQIFKSPDKKSALVILKTFFRPPTQKAAIFTCFLLSLLPSVSEWQPAKEFQLSRNSGCIIKIGSIL